MKKLILAAALMAAIAPTVNADALNHSNYYQRTHVISCHEWIYALDWGKTNPCWDVLDEMSHIEAHRQRFWAGHWPATDYLPSNY